MRVEKKTKHLHIEFIVTSHNSVQLKSLYLSANISTKTAQLGCVVIGLIKD